MLNERRAHSMKLLILHGWGGSDAPHWQAELAAEVGKHYGTVSFPLIQHPHFPSLNRWRREVLAHLHDFKPDTVVCHSLANTLWFHLAAAGELVSVKRLFMVSPPSLRTVIEGLDDFYPAPLPDTLYSEEAQLIVSDNDPYIPLSEARETAAYFDIPLTVLKGAGHINADSGYGKWAWMEKLVMEEQ